MLPVQSKPRGGEMAMLAAKREAAAEDARAGAAARVLSYGEAALLGNPALPVDCEE